MIWIKSKVNRLRSKWTIHWGQTERSKQLELGGHVSNSKVRKTQSERFAKVDSRGIRKWTVQRAGGSKRMDRDGLKEWSWTVEKAKTGRSLGKFKFQRDERSKGVKILNKGWGDFR